MFNKKMFNGKKSLAVALTLSVLTNLFGISANTSRQAEAKAPSVSHISYSKVVKTLAKHPISIVSGVIALGFGASVIAETISNEINLRRVLTSTKNMSDEQVLKFRNEQIAKFEKTGNGIFEVDQQFIDELPARVTALILAETNEIFRAYPNITRTFINRNKILNRKFRIRLTNDSELSSESTMALYNGDMAFNKKHFHSLRKIWSTSEKDKNTGYHPAADNPKLIESVVAHEMGHLIEYMLCYTSCENYKSYFQRTPNNTGEGSSVDPETTIKNEILKIARDKFNYKGKGYISRYGKKNDSEWFAEVCAHALCSEKPNVLGLAFKEFLNIQEKSLANSCQTNIRLY